MLWAPGEKTTLLGCGPGTLWAGALRRVVGSPASEEINTAGVGSLTTGMPAMGANVTWPLDAETSDDFIPGRVPSKLIDHPYHFSTFPPIG